MPSDPHAAPGDPRSGPGPGAPGGSRSGERPASSGDAATPSRRRRPARRVGRGVAWALIGLLGLITAIVVVVLVALQTDWGKERVRRFALERLRGMVEGRVDVARLGGDFLHGIELDGVSITGLAGEPLLSLERLRVQYDAGGFLRQQLLFGEILLVAPRITLVQDSTGRWNYATVLPFLTREEEPPPEAPGGWGSVLRVEELRIVRGDVRVITRLPGRTFGPLGGRAHVGDLNGRIEIEISARDEEDRKRFGIEDLSFVLDEPRLGVREVDARVEMTPDGVDLEEVLLRTARTELSGEGTVRELAAVPVLDLAFRAAPLALEELRGFTAVEIPAGATVRGTVTLEGPSDSLQAGLEDFVAETPRSRIEAEGGVRLTAQPVLDGRLAIPRLDPEDARAVYPAYPLEQPLEARLSASGSRERMELDGAVAFGGTSATVAGTVGFPDSVPAYDLRLAVRELDVEDFLRDPAWRSVVNADVHVEGKGREAGVRASVEDTRIRGYRLVSGSLEGRLAGETFRADAIRLRLPRTEVRASGTLRAEGPLDVEFRVVSRDLGDLAPGSGPMPAGRFETAGTASGSLGTLRVEADVAADSLVARGTYVERLRADASVSGVGGARMTGLVEGHAAGVLAPGGVALDSTAFRVGLAGRTADVTVAVLADSLRSAEAHALVDLGRASPRIVLDELGIARADQRWSLREPGRLVYERGQVRFEDFALESGGQRIALDGTLDLQGRQDLRFSLEDLRLEDMQRLAGREPAASGVLGASGALAGTARAPVLEADLRLEDGRAGGLGIRRLGGSVDYEDRRLALDLELVPDSLEALGPDTPAGPSAETVADGVQAADDPAATEAAEAAEPADATDAAEAAEAGVGDGAPYGTIVATGTVPLDLGFTGVSERFPDGAMDLRIESRGLNPAVLPSVSALGEGPPPPVQLAIRMTGSPSDPLLDASFALVDVQLGALAVNRLAADVEYADREVRLDVRLEPKTSPASTDDGISTATKDEVPAGATAPPLLTVAGTFPADLSLGAERRTLPEREMDLRAEGTNLTLALLHSVSPRITEASGPVRLDVRLTGTPEEPRYDGLVALEDGALRIGEGGTRYSGIRGTVRFDNDLIAIEGLRIGSGGGGEARLDGRIALRNLALGDVEAGLQASRFTLIDEGERLLVVDADLGVSGTTQAPAVTGTVNVEQLEWPIPERSDKDVIDLNDAIIYVRAVGDTAAAAAAPPDVFTQTLLNVDVTVEDDAILKNPKTLIVLEGDLSIDKARGAPRPSIAGSLEVVRGYYSDFGKQFDVSQGEIFFYGTPDLDPGLNVVATTVVENKDTGGDVAIELTLGGTASEPRLDVSSAPAYDRSEIFSLLLFGTTTPGQGQEGRFEDTVGKLAAGQAAGPLQRALASELGLDLLEIQPGIGAEGGAGVRAGKYIAPDVFVTYRQASGPGGQGNQFGIQYRLSDSWALETQAGTRQFGADLFYEFQY